MGFGNVLGDYVSINEVFWINKYVCECKSIIKLGCGWFFFIFVWVYRIEVIWNVWWSFVWCDDYLDLFLLVWSKIWVLKVVYLSMSMNWEDWRKLYIIKFRNMKSNVDVVYELGYIV